MPLDVVDEDALALQEPLVLLARDALAAPALLHLDRRRRDGRRASSRHFADRLHGLDDVPVAGAAADVALQRLLDLVLGRARVRAQQRRRAHQHPRRAVAALERVVVVERLLQRGQLAVRRRGPRPSRSLAPSAWTASSMQLFTSAPSTITEHAPQLPVSQPMWLPVRSRSSRRKWMRSLRGSTSRSYSRAVDGDRDVHQRFSAACRAARVGEHLGEMRAVLARRVDVGRRIDARAAHGARARPSGESAVDDDRHRVDAAERDAQRAVHARGGVRDARAVDAERDRGEAVVLAGGDRDPRQQLARPDRGQVDAEEELVRAAPSRSPPAPAIVIRAPIATMQRRQVVRRVVRADVAADRAAVPHLDVGDLRADLAEDRPRPRLRRAP